MSGAREYWPEAYCDEMMPASRPNPDAWIERLPNGDFQLADYNEDEDGQPVRHGDGIVIQNGQVIEFCWCQPTPDIEITVNPDGSFEQHSKVDPNSTHFWLSGDPDTLDYSLAEFARHYAQNDVFPASLPEQMTVRTACWGDECYRFVVLDTTARFELATPDAATAEPVKHER